METALWATIGSTLALIFKGVAAGDKSDVESQLEVLRKQLADANTRNGELKNQYGTLTLQARKEALYEEKTKADTQRREIAEAETVWSRATPEVLLQFAKDRQKIANPNPMDDVNPFSGTPPPPPPSTGETAPSTGETAPGGVVAVVATEGDTDESPMADEVVNPPEEDVPAKETVNPPPPPPPPAPLKPEDLPTEEGDDPFEPAPSSSTRTSFDQEPKQALKGGAAVDKSLAAKVPAINDVYANLEQSSMARGYVVRGSLMALYGKLVAAWKSEKGEDPLPPELQQSAFLKGVKEELLAIATGKSSAVADARASAKELKDTVKGIRKWADDTVSESKQVLNEGAPLRNWFDTVPPKKLAKQYPALRGLVVLDASNEDAYVASVNAKTFLNQSKEYVRQWNQLSGLIEQGRDALAAKRSQAVPDDKLLAHLQESIDTLSEAVGAMKALNKVMTTDKETILEEIETNRTILKDTGIRKGDIEKGEAQVQEELDARRAALQELQAYKDQEAAAAHPPAAEAAAEAAAAQPPAAEAAAAQPAAAEVPAAEPSVKALDLYAKPGQLSASEQAAQASTALHDAILVSGKTNADKGLAATRSLEEAKRQLTKTIGLLPKPYQYKGGCAIKLVTTQVVSLCDQVLGLLGRAMPILKRDLEAYTKETRAQKPSDLVLDVRASQRKQELAETKAELDRKIASDITPELDSIVAYFGSVNESRAAKTGGANPPNMERVWDLYFSIAAKVYTVETLLPVAIKIQRSAAIMMKEINKVIKTTPLSEAEQEEEKKICSKEAGEWKRVLKEKLKETETGVESNVNPLFAKTGRTSSSTMVPSSGVPMTDRKGKKTPNATTEAAATPPSSGREQEAVLNAPASSSSAAAPTESLQSKTFAELTAMRRELEPEYRQLYAELYGPPGGPRYAVDSRDPRHMALQAALDPVQARWEAIAAELKTRPETIQAQQEKNRVRLDEARKELEKSIKRQAELDPDSDLSHRPEAASLSKTISSLNREIARLEAALGSAAAPPLGVLEMEAPAGPIPPGDFAGAPVVQPPISATEAASALPGMAPETPGTTLELPSVGDRPPAAAAPADTPGQGVELTPVQLYQKTSTRGLTKGEAQEAPAVKAARSMRNLFASKGGSRKSTFKRRRVGKQNGRRTRRSKNRANRTHSHAR